MIEELLTQTHRGPVFGPNVAFGEISPERALAIGRQVKSIARILEPQLFDALKNAYPELSPEDFRLQIKETLSKASCFCPALTAGEMPDDTHTVALSMTALSISCMYLADANIDRDDETTLLAVEDSFYEADKKPKIPPELAAAVKKRQTMLTLMKDTINSFALDDDAPYVLECYDQLVLKNEAKLHRLSSEYRSRDQKARRLFLAEQAGQLATLMVADAGFQSVTASLYTLYRREDSSLLPLPEVHTDPGIIKLLQICNTVARVADERGDWWMDAGNDPKKGVFSINPFNEYHPEFVQTLCSLAHIEDTETIGTLQHAFANFHASDTERERYGTRVTDIFFAHVRDYINNLPTDFRNQHDRYIRLCMRVLEISHVNMMGDIRLAGDKQPVV